MNSQMFNFLFTDCSERRRSYLTLNTKRIQLIQTSESLINNSKVHMYQPISRQLIPQSRRLSPPLLKCFQVQLNLAVVPGSVVQTKPKQLRRLQLS